MIRRSLILSSVEQDGLEVYVSEIGDLIITIIEPDGTEADGWIMAPPAARDLLDYLRSEVEP